jgi:hypothetical protein
LLAVGPRQFLNLFSLTLSVGQKVRRKKKNSFEKVEWNRQDELPRVKGSSISFEEREEIVGEQALQELDKIQQAVIY